MFAKTKKCLPLQHGKQKFGYKADLQVKGYNA